MSRVQSQQTQAPQNFHCTYSHFPFIYIYLIKEAAWIVLLSILSAFLLSSTW